jgi:hypothetical protein
LKQGVCPSSEPEKDTTHPKDMKTPEQGALCGKITTIGKINEVEQQPGPQEKG